MSTRPETNSVQTFTTVVFRQQQQANPNSDSSRFSNLDGCTPGGVGNCTPRTMGIYCGGKLARHQAPAH